MKCFIFVLLTATAFADDLPEITVMAQRSDSPGGSILAEWNRDSIRGSSPRTLDELLADEPSFSLYRRQTALFGNPTSAGVSLRNTGATAASRTLVLLDGIPQNDPFGGWVYWARYEPAAIDSVKIISSAESAVWGNQSPAGVIQMTSRDPFQDVHLLRAGAGSDRTYSAASLDQFTNATQTFAASVSASTLHSDGFYGVADSQRGPVDRRFDLDLTSADVKFSWRPQPGITVEPDISYYREDRGNGTPLTKNSTEAIDLGLRVSFEEETFSWQALGYYQKRDFESFFSSVNADRSTETPSLDQFDVPATSTGGALTFHWKPDAKWSVTSGLDFRHVEGETNEDATFIAGQFTRRREAGGEQSVAGIFTSASYRIDSQTHLDASLRADVWWLDDGRRIEDSKLTGANLRDDRQPDREGVEPSIALSLAHDFTDRWTAYASAGSSFRLPTLNELHRPYRVKNDIVEANAGLDPERFISLEGGIEWKPVNSVRWKNSVFHHWIEDAIANVPVTDAAEISAIFGSIPAGGSGAQRRNVDEAQVSGIQSEIEWQASHEITLRFDGIYTKTRFTRSPDQPLLKDQPFPQSPDLKLIAAVDWKLSTAFSVSAGYEYGASQFDDALAQRRIADYFSARIGLTWQPVDKLLCQIRIDNLFDEEVQTGASSDGTRSIAGPRSLWTSVEWSF